MGKAAHSTGQLFDDLGEVHNNIPVQADGNLMDTLAHRAAARTNAFRKAIDRREDRMNDIFGQNQRIEMGMQIPQMNLPQVKGHVQYGTNHGQDGSPNMAAHTGNLLSDINKHVAGRFNAAAQSGADIFDSGMNLAHQGIQNGLSLAPQGLHDLFQGAMGHLKDGMNSVSGPNHHFGMKLQTPQLPQLKGHAHHGDNHGHHGPQHMAGMNGAAGHSGAGILTTGKKPAHHETHKAMKQTPQGMHAAFQGANGHLGGGMDPISDPNHRFEMEFQGPHINVPGFNVDAHQGVLDGLKLASQGLHVALQGAIGHLNNGMDPISEQNPQFSVDGHVHHDDNHGYYDAPHLPGQIGSSINEHLGGMNKGAKHSGAGILNAGRNPAHHGTQNGMKQSAQGTPSAFHGANGHHQDGMISDPNYHFGLGFQTPHIEVPQFHGHGHRDSHQDHIDALHKAAHTFGQIGDNMRNYAGGMINAATQPVADIFQSGMNLGLPGIQNGMRQAAQGMHDAFGGAMNSIYNPNHQFEMELQTPHIGYGNHDSIQGSYGAPNLAEHADGQIGNGMSLQNGGMIDVPQMFHRGLQNGLSSTAQGLHDAFNSMHDALNLMPNLSASVNFGSGVDGHNGQQQQPYQHPHQPHLQQSHH